MTSNMRQKDIRPAPALIEFKGMKFLITDRPSDSNIQNYILVRQLRRSYKFHLIFFYSFSIIKTEMSHENVLNFVGIEEK